MKINIAIDGYSSCGKSTLARQLAEQLHYRYIDTGAMYRAITVEYLREDVAFNEEDAIAEAVDSVHLRFESRAHSEVSEMYLNDENVGRGIRDMIGAEKVSQVAAIKSVRALAVKQQQAMG